MRRDRIVEASGRFARHLHGEGRVVFAARVAILAERFISEHRTTATHAIQRAAAQGRISGEERATGLLILDHWHAQAPGAQLAVMVLIAELADHRSPLGMRLLDKFGA